LIVCRASTSHVDHAEKMAPGRRSLHCPGLMDGMNDAETMGTGGNATCSMGNHPII